jgi:hypothetical protein
LVIANLCKIRRIRIRRVTGIIAAINTPPENPKTPLDLEGSLKVRKPVETKEEEPGEMGADAGSKMRFRNVAIS